MPMAVRVYCDDPGQLLADIRRAIRADKIETWELDSDGDFTHSPSQWKNQAWFHPVVEDERLIFRIIGQKSKRMSKEIYGVYHGRFIEMLLAHFDTKFRRASATALPSNGDQIGRRST
jgi:hypothetical protein